jgi:DNA invertase Pin-like site-specific DNA recombinase
MKTPVAWAYVRVSNQEQASGHGPERQIEGALSYAKLKGLPLSEDRIIQDIGRSAFTGSNISKGKLGILLKEVTAEKYPAGTALIVESVDRLSRQGIREAQKILDVFMDAGIVVHAYGDHRVYDRDTYDIGTHITSAVESDRANRESRIKLHRQCATWESKREEGATNRVPLTARCPSWLELPYLPRQDGKQRKAGGERKFTVIKERAATVKRIFEASARGRGNTVIARELNEDKVPTFGPARGWGVSSVGKILTSRSVMGEYQPGKLVAVKGQTRKRNEPIGEAIQNYYPVVISPELFHRAQQSRAQRTQDNMPRGGRKGTNYSNLFSGILKCSYCGAPYYFENKGKGDTYLVCHGARSGWGCKRVGWRYKDFEASFLALVNEIDWASIAQSDEESRKRLAVQHELDGMRGEHAAIVEQQDVALELLDRSKLNSVQRKLEALELKATTLADKIEAKEKELATMDRTVIALHEGRDHINALRERIQNFKTRAEIAAHIKSMVAAIYVAPRGLKKGQKLAFELRVDKSTPEQRYLLNFDLLTTRQEHKRVPLKHEPRCFIVELQTGKQIVVRPRSDSTQGYRLVSTAPEDQLPY